ncbi:hypothetical protein HDU91_005371, partial [Kappamyces sp. JEL0680]
WHFLSPSTSRCSCSSASSRDRSTSWIPLLLALLAATLSLEQTTLSTSRLSCISFREFPRGLLAWPGRRATCPLQTTRSLCLPPSLGEL